MPTDANFSYLRLITSENLVRVKQCLKSLLCIEAVFHKVRSLVRSQHSRKPTVDVDDVREDRDSYPALQLNFWKKLQRLSRAGKSTVCVWYLGRLWMIYSGRTVGENTDLGKLPSDSNRRQASTNLVHHQARRSGTGGFVSTEAITKLTGPEDSCIQGLEPNACW